MHTNPRVKKVKIKYFLRKLFLHNKLSLFYFILFYFILFYFSVSYNIPRKVKTTPTPAQPGDWPNGKMVPWLE